MRRKEVVGFKIFRDEILPAQLFRRGFEGGGETRGRREGCGGKTWIGREREGDNRRVDVDAAAFAWREGGSDLC